MSRGRPEMSQNVLEVSVVPVSRSALVARLEQVAHHYHLFGGRSPINDQCRSLLAALEAELAAEHKAAEVTLASARAEADDIVARSEARALVAEIDREVPHGYLHFSGTRSASSLTRAGSCAARSFCSERSRSRL